MMNEGNSIFFLLQLFYIKVKKTRMKTMAFFPFSSADCWGGFPEGQKTKGLHGASWCLNHKQDEGALPLPLMSAAGRVCCGSMVWSACSPAFDRGKCEVKLINV